MQQASYACSVCGGELSDEKVIGYRIMTALLALIPICLLSLLFYLAYKKYGSTD